MKTINEMIAIMKAFEEGKEIEYYDTNNSVWSKIECPLWNWFAYDYRVKSEPEYRPYKDANEFIEAQIKHGMYLYFKSRCVYKLATGINMRSIAILWDSCRIEEISYKDLLIQATWQDGTPCGVEEK